MTRKRFVIIGISDCGQPFFPPEVAAIITAGKVFSGGERHHEIVRGLLPAGYRWIDIRVPLREVFRQYEACFAANAEDIIVFASGDPFFYGFASTIRRECPAVPLTVFPAFNSLQMLAHRMQLPYERMRAVSVTGRPWDALDEALIQGEPLIGCLTDRHKTPQAIWQRMQDYGFSNYTMTVGENLGNEEAERVRTFTPGDAMPDAEFCFPNCLILCRTALRERPFGLPEQDFHLLDGRARMITKMPIRLLSLSMLDLRGRQSFWDIGFCTGSVSIEAKLQFPHLRVTAFEVREEGQRLMEQNSRRFGTPGITTVIGDFLEADLSQYPAPEAVFIGGHGGRLREMVARLSTVMQPGCTLVFNSVTDESRTMFLRSVEPAGLQFAGQTQITIDTHNPIVILKATKPISEQS